MESPLSWEVSFIYSKLFAGSFCDIAHPYKLFTQPTHDVPGTSPEGPRKVLLSETYLETYLAEHILLK